MQSDEEVGKVAQAVPIIIYILFSEMLNIHSENLLIVFVINRLYFKQ